ncbi:Transcriptional regulator, TetR family [Acidisarcina polymorpha]|uniref:Transcriptional regulator, TetR family n=1 Tax=Acidisarcina polymorpha TaxID=2211140 RepID=A0A2Z5G180_9BACT|nr:TetR/AcrR family transcriptional regulator [Acidisarcina polymorpha]AXC12819.1 Transcriptional regulator, TetR family [Acidisarcina polymorpha]
MKSETAENIIPAITEQIDRRKSLLQAAFDVIAASGFEGLRTRAVAERAGVNIATLHYYFPTKQLLIEGLAQFLTGIFMTLHAPPLPLTGYKALDQLRQEFLDTRFYNDRYPELQIVMEELSLRAKRDPGVQQALGVMLQSWRAWIATIVQGGIAERAFRRDLDPEDTVATLMAVMAGKSVAGSDELNRIQRGVESWLLAPEVKKKLKESNHD